MSFNSHVSLVTYFFAQQPSWLVFLFTNENLQQASPMARHLSTTPVFLFLLPNILVDEVKSLGPIMEMPALHSLSQ